MDILKTLSATPLPNILVVGGLIFIALALGSQIGGRIELPSERQKMAGMLGFLLLLFGLSFYFLPAGTTPQTSVTPPAANGQNPGIASPAAANGTATSTQEQATAEFLNSVSGCFESFFSGLPADRISTLESGVQDEVLIDANQNKEQGLGIQFTNNRQIVGAITLHFFMENEFFKIVSVVDSHCEHVTDYENASRGGDQDVLQNWDALEIRLSGLLYNLNLDYSDGEIKADFFQVVE